MKYLITVYTKVDPSSIWKGKGNVSDEFSVPNLNDAFKWMEEHPDDLYSLAEVNVVLDLS